MPDSPDTPAALPAPVEEALQSLSPDQLREVRRQCDAALHKPAPAGSIYRSDVVNMTAAQARAMANGELKVVEG